MIRWPEHKSTRNSEPPNLPTSIEGRLVCGPVPALAGTHHPWFRRQLIEAAGIDPHPEPVHLELEDEARRVLWRSWRDLPAPVIEAVAGISPRLCCHPVRIAGSVPAALLVPVAGSSPAQRVALVTALPLRKQLSLAEHAAVRVELCRPLAAAAVLFDIDGTLVDSITAYVAVARSAAEPFGLEVTEANVRQALATGTSFWQAVVPENHQDGAALTKTLSAHAARAWPQVLRAHGRVLKGLSQTLDALLEAGIRLGIVSGARPEVLELLREEGLLEKFEAVVLGGDVACKKPHPEGILTCLGQLRVPPAKAVYVGDTPIDIQASRAAGVAAVGVLTGAGDSAMLSAQYPDWLIASHTRLPAILHPV